MGYFGCHLSASGGNLAMVKTAQSIGANTFAFFTRNPRGSKAKAEDPSDCQKAVALLREQNFGTLVAHGAYTMNLCTADPEARAFAASVLLDDLRRMEARPGQYYNFHPGSHVGQGTEMGIDLISKLLNSILWKEQTTTVLLETMAGKGSEVGRNFEEIRAIIDKVELNDKLGVCLDTCHIWDGGYDIVNKLDEVIEEFDKVIGLDRLKAIHLNDTMNDLGIIVSLQIYKSDSQIQYEMQELEQLCNACHIDIVNSYVQKADTINAATYIGKGKAFDIASDVHDKNVTVVIGVYQSKKQTKFGGIQIILKKRKKLSTN